VPKKLSTGALRCWQVIGFRAGQAVSAGSDGAGAPHRLCLLTPMWGVGQGTGRSGPLSRHQPAPRQPDIGSCRQLIAGKPACPHCARRSTCVIGALRGNWRFSPTSSAFVCVCRRATVGVAPERWQSRRFVGNRQPMRRCPMATQPPPASRGIHHRSAAEHDLSHLFAEVTSAREAVRVTKGAPRRDDTYRSDCSRLAASLGAYVRALERYRLPVPRQIRDELRLRRQLPS